MLQAWLYTPGHIHWYDVAAVAIYYMHFAVPFIAGIVFWLIDRAFFKKYAASIVVLSYAAFVTYIIFPAEPPWMAAQQGFLPFVQPITSQVLASFAHPISLPTVYAYVGANLVAPVPSLHAGYALITAMFVSKKFPKWGWVSFLYPAAMFLVVVYLGEHYVFDIVVATAYVLVIYAFATDWHGWGTWLKSCAMKLFTRQKRSVSVQ